MFARGHNDNVVGRTLCAPTKHVIYTFVGCDAYITPRNDVGIVPYDYLTNTC